MHRFYTPPENIKEKIIIKDSSEIHHLKDVLRMKIGEETIIFDGKGNEYNAKINSLSNHEVVLLIIDKKEGGRKNLLQVCLACALPKKSKSEFIVEKATELGAQRVIPLKTVRTIVDLKGERAERKVERWQEIAVNASKQSQRKTVPKIEKIHTFNQAMQEIKKYDLCLIPCLFGKRKKIEDLLMHFSGKSIMVFIGPEGDFTAEEVRLAIKSGCQLVTLGEQVLKVDSAAFYTLSVINFISQMKR
ncbi:MAG: RsmE family RNA methyltransferase [Candidatus Omnitrophota bacterium]|nr:RsmE family RNA methyltransferase [Candidatus Omnitrophota bacterium]